MASSRRGYGVAGPGQRGVLGQQLHGHPAPRGSDRRRSRPRGGL